MPNSRIRRTGRHHHLDGAGGHLASPAFIGEDERIASLRAYAILDTPSDPVFNELVRNAAQDLAMPIARLNLLDVDRQWTKASFGAPSGTSIPRNIAFCSHVICNPDSITISPDTTLDPRFRRNPFVLGEPHIRFYAGVPLKDKAGRVLGAFSVMDIEPRQLDAAALDRLSFLADVGASRMDFYRVNQALKESEAHYRATIDLLPQIPWTADPNGAVLEASPRWLDVTGLPEDQAHGNGWMQALHPDDTAITTSTWQACLATGERLDLQYRLRMRDGSYRWFRTRAAPRRDASGTIVLWYGTVEDIHASRLASMALKESEYRLRLALEVGGLGVWEYDVATASVTASDLCAQAFGLARGEDLATYEAALAALHKEDRAVLDREREVALTTDRGLDVELRSIWPDGSEHWLRLTGRAIFGADGSPLKAFGLAVDITERHQVNLERARVQAQLLHLANHDPLTGLANRRLFNVRLAEAMARNGTQARTALLCIDLDRFKSVNDRMGHASGDDLLCLVSARLLAVAGVSDTVARCGGDEFAVLVGDVADVEAMHTLARTIVTVLSEPFAVGGCCLTVGGTVGVSVAPEDASDAAQLKRNADAALRRAKIAGRGSYTFFSPEIDAGLQAREMLKSGIQDALEAGQFHLLYQPIVDLATMRISGFEALMRWRHPERGVIQPEDFIPLAEEAGWVGRLGRWALHEACSAAARWPGGPAVAVNLSALQFASGRLEDDVAAALQASRLEPGRLELEVTETLLLQDSIMSLATLKELRKIGVRLVMDDFGTGYSSLAYLRKFNFDTIKVDKSLVQGLPDAGGGDMIVKAIIDLGRSLGVAITAEGIENAQQLAFLRRNRCAQGQGYFFSKPVSEADIAALTADDWAVGA